MGHLFAVPPSPFEADHAGAIKAGMEYQATHDSALPGTPAWHALERRYDLNPLRFQYWHPNLSLMIARSRTIEKPDVWPIDRCSPYQHEPCVQVEPPRGGSTNPQVVPEPSAIVLLAIGAAWAWRAWR